MRGKGIKKEGAVGGILVDYIIAAFRRDIFLFFPYRYAFP